MELLLSPEFEKRFCKLSKSIQKKAVKQQEVFINDPFYPSLHTEKLKPRSKELWSIRVDKTYRIVFRRVNSNTVLLLTVGTHDWIYKIVNNF